MLQWIETHAHLQDSAFAQDLDSVLERATAAGISKIVLPACSEQDAELVLEICMQHPDYCYPAIGLHPGEIGTNPKQQLATLSALLPDATPIAVGEIGLDLFHYKDTISRQIPVFEQQLQWALYYDLPVLIHARQAIDLVLGILERAEFRRVRGVLHAFEGDLQQLQRAQKNDNLMVGIGGIATFKNGLTEEVLRALDLSRTVTETDSPYLAPVPYRGKRNEPAYIPHIGERIANVSALTLEDVAKQTSRAAHELLNFQ